MDESTVTPAPIQSTYYRVPGVSFIPDPVTDGDNEDIQAKFQVEFIHFVKSVSCILDLARMLRSKHLKTLKPLPPDLLREIKKTGKKGPLFKKFDRMTAGNISGLSTTVNQALSRGLSTISPSALSLKWQAVSLRSGMRKASTRKSQKSVVPHLDAHLVDVIGRRTIPIWQQVALEKHPDELEQKVRERQSRNIVERIDVNNVPLWKAINDKDVPLTRTWSQTLLSNVRILADAGVYASTVGFQEQMDVLQARAIGLSSVDEYYEHLENLKPHWYKDLVSDALKVGLLSSDDVRCALEDLGYRHYNMEPDRVPLLKAKICFLVSSFPIWDICRIHIQRAVEFILHDIMKIDPSENVLETWLSYRKLPYVVTAPIFSLDLDTYFRNPTPSSVLPKIEAEENS